MLNNNEKPSADATKQESETELLADEPTIDQIADSLQKAVEQKQAPKIPEPIPQITSTITEQKLKNPLYEKYIPYANRYPDSVIAMRVGDFYQVFGKKATLIADKANLTLTGRNFGLEQRIPMVGFPCHAAEAYIKKIRQSYSVVIVDGDDVRKLAEFGIEDVIDGDYKLTDEEEQLIDDLTVEEMRKFDGDIAEPKDVPSTPSKEQAKVTFVSTDPDSPYDETALAKVVKLLGDCFILG